MPPRIQVRVPLFVCSSCRHRLLRHAQRQHSTRATTTPEIYDVVTVGGGPVGLALLTALKSSPVTSHLRCALIEAQDLSKAQGWKMSPDQYSNRASSLTPTNVSFLESIGAWRHVDQSRVQAYDEMQVWDAANDASIQFDWRSEATKYNAPPQTVATMTENANLTRGLLNRLSELEAGGSLLTNTSVASISNGEDNPEGLNLSTWPVVTLTSARPATSASEPNTVATRLLIGADGFNSPVRAFAGIASNGWDYNRHGVVATLKLEAREPTTFADPNSLDSLFSSDEESSIPSNRATAYQRFLPALGGPIAILPLPDNHASLVWSTTPEIAAKLKQLSPAGFVATVNAALRLSQVDVKYMLSLDASASHSPTPEEVESPHENELSWRLGHTPPHPTVLPPTVVAVQDSTIASFPLRFRHTTTLTNPRIALAGDAAHTIHPLAGQGLNLGLADVQSLSETISHAVEHGMDIGDSMTLERYGSQRFGKGLRMAAGVDMLNWAYQLGGSESTLLGDGVLGTLTGFARGLGMKAVNQFDIVKGVIMRQAE